MEIPFYIYFIALSLIVSIMRRIRNDDGTFYLRVFPYYLCATLIIEVLGVYRWWNGMSTTALYNFFGLFEFTFYFFILHEVIHSRAMKKVVRSFLIVYPLLFLINITFVQVNGFASITYVLGCLLVSSVCVYYFYELFESRHSVVLIREPAFWFCTALLFFYCCTFPYFGLANFLIDFPQIIMDNIAVLLNLMNSLLYSLFTIAFLCRIRIRKFT